MNTKDFETFRDFLLRQSGLVIGPDKTYLLESRLTPIAKTRNLDGLPAIAQALRLNQDKELANAVIEAMTTNETSFFRDIKPFDILKDIVIPELAEKRKSTRKLNIWSAACSSGQEPYSIAMVLKEAKQLQGWDIKITATDISHDILNIARQAQYSQFEVQRGLPIQYLMNYFTQHDTHWHLNDTIKAMVEFKYLNLLEKTIALGRFDIVFCRNVLIYFNDETKRKVLDMLASNMQDDGYLFLGSAESVLGITDSFAIQTNARGLYTKKQAQELCSTTL